MVRGSEEEHGGETAFGKFKHWSLKYSAALNSIEIDISEAT